MHMKQIASSAWHVLLNFWNITSNQNGPAYIQARRVRGDSATSLKAWSFMEQVAFRLGSTNTISTY
jgi:hypothetical protein